MFRRNIINTLDYLAQKFPVVCVTGPRQSGKTVLVKSHFPNYDYVTLEDFDNRAYAEHDPRGFLSEYSKKVIIDEAQKVPHLFSYIQTKVDELDSPGQYILTSSEQLNLHQNISQSLAGRAALLYLMPLSLSEMVDNNLLQSTLDRQLLGGFYPRIYKDDIDPTKWYSNYIDIYIERDVRNILQIRNLIDFQRFLCLCAGRHGQVLDITHLANGCGISRTTAKEWLSVLQASFLIYLLPPYYNNYNKRLIRSPKLYFYDSGIVCSLLDITEEKQLRNYYLRGAVYEGYVISECMKRHYNLGIKPRIFYWREKNGNEIDCIVDHKGTPIAIEIKSSATIHHGFFKNLLNWQKYTGNKAEHCFLIHGGVKKETRKQCFVLGWHMIDNIFNKSS